MNMPVSKYHLNRIAAWIIGKFLNHKINDLTCGFRAYNREALLRLNLPGNFTYTQEVIIDAIGKNLKIIWVPVEVIYFPDRESRVVKSVYRYVNNSARLILKAVRDVRPDEIFWNTRYDSHTHQWEFLRILFLCIFKPSRFAQALN